MARALIVADLPGVGGVDALDDLFLRSIGYRQATRRMAEEVNTVSRQLINSGFDSVRVVDTFQFNLPFGALSPKNLLPGVELRNNPDLYSATILEGVDAVACLGMHAPAGGPGFAAHTLDLHSAWVCEGRSLSEAEILLALCFEKSIPILFVSGDDVLREQLSPDVPYVQVKKSLGYNQSMSDSTGAVLSRLGAASGNTPKLVPAFIPSLTLFFKSKWQADLAASESLKRTGDCSLQIEGRSFRDRYDSANRISEKSRYLVRQAFRGNPGQTNYNQDLRAELQRKFIRRTHTLAISFAEKSLVGFLRTSDTDRLEHLTLRGLILHMLSSYCPNFFLEMKLGVIFKETVSRLRSIPGGVSLNPGTSASHLEAAYVLSEHGLPVASFSRSIWACYIFFLKFVSPLDAWLTYEFLGKVGMKLSAPVSPRAVRNSDREQDLYWLTHLFLLKTNYLTNLEGLGNLDLLSEREELLLAAPLALESSHLDLAAELVFCLKIAGEDSSLEYGMLLDMLALHQSEDGTLRYRKEDPVHTTGVALLAFAGATEEHGSL